MGFFCMLCWKTFNTRFEGQLFHGIFANKTRAAFDRFGFFFKPSEVAELISFTIKLAKTVMETQPNYFQ